MRIRRTIPALLTLTLCMVALAPRQAGHAQATASPAQHEASPAPPGITLHVVSRETVVDVTVTDSKGNPVHGLKQSDFTVREDGKPQAIHSFEEFGQATSVATQPLPKLPPNVYTNLQPPPASSALNILLLDFVNTAPVLAVDCCQIVPCPFHGPGEPKCNNPSAGPQEVGRAVAAQRRVKLDAMNYLQHMPPGTQVEVIGMWWPGTLRVLQGFTSDPALLSAAVNTMSYDTNSTVAGGSPDPASTSSSPVARTRALNKIDDASSDETNALIGGGTLYEQICQQADGRDRMTLEALQQIATDLAGVKGKKNLIWFTVGTPYISNPGVRPSCLPNYSAGLARADSLLMAAQVALYPIDARGVMTMPDDLLELSGKLMLKVSALSGDLRANALTQFALKTSAEQLALEDWAERTGGAAFYNTNDLAGALAKAIDTGANYYTLSYIPPGTKFDGRHHTIKIAVDEPGLHLVYRDGYAAEDPSIFKPVPGLTLATAPPGTGPGSPPVDMRLAMGRSMPASQQLLFDVQVEPSTEPAKPADPPIFGAIDAKLAAKPLTRYGFEYVLPARQITFATTAQGNRKASLEFDLAAYDAQGKLINSLSQSIDPMLTAAQQQQLVKGPFRFFQQLDLPSGQLFVRIGVLDRASNKVGTLEIPLLVDKKSASLKTQSPAAPSPGENIAK